MPWHFSAISKDPCSAAVEPASGVGGCVCPGREGLGRPVSSYLGSVT